MFHFFIQKSLIVSEEDQLTAFKKNLKQQQNDSVQQQQQQQLIGSTNISNSLTDVNDEIKITNGEIGRVTKWAIGFEKLLEDQIGLQVFTVRQ